MDFYESILSANRNSILLTFHEDFQNVTAYLFYGAIVAVIFCLTHYFYLNVLRDALDTYLLKGKCLRI
jgi:hypothetical protein